MSIIGISLFALGITAVISPPSFPNAANLPVITELPDPFLLPTGKRVRSKSEWQKHRRALLSQILHYEYGEFPPVVHQVKAYPKSERLLDSPPAVEKEYLLKIGQGENIQTRFFLTTPSGDGPFPVIVTGDIGWGRIKPDIVAEVVRRGYALAEFSREEIAPDSAVRGGVYAAYPEFESGRLAAWAWGYHRVIDYLCTLDQIDKAKIIVTGHSRGGKTALLAGASDERVALTAPNNSGCGGAGCYKFQAEKSEDIAIILKNLGYWFHPRFHDFIGNIDRLPFDQHTLKALVAPRALLSTEALGDLWANPKGTQQTYLAAKEVFNFLGASDKIGIHYREGGHEQGLDDWRTLLDFADYQFSNKKPDYDFHKLEFRDLPKIYSWKAP